MDIRINPRWWSPKPPYHWFFFHFLAFNSLCCIYLFYLIFWPRSKHLVQNRKDYRACVVSVMVRVGRPTIWEHRDGNPNTEAWIPLGMDPTAPPCIPALACPAQPSHFSPFLLLFSVSAKGPHQTNHYLNTLSVF